MPLQRMWAMQSTGGTAPSCRGPHPSSGPRPRKECGYVFCLSEKKMLKTFWSLKQDPKKGVRRGKGGKNKNVSQNVNVTLPCSNSQVLPFYLSTTFLTLIPESALVSAWNSDSNLSLLIVRHPLARLVSVYYNKLVQYTYTQYSTVQYIEEL